MNMMKMVVDFLVKVGYFLMEELIDMIDFLVTEKSFNIEMFRIDNIFSRGMEEIF